MTYYLYVKTHNITGLKYLGQTRSKNPYMYLGSGKYWRKHLNVHGSDITTEILLMTESKNELVETGMFFSSLWNIVKSDKFANLTEERGSGGNLFTLETYEKIKKTKLEKYGNPYFNNRESFLTKNGITNISQLDSVRAKISESLTGKPKTELHKKNMQKPKSESAKKNLSLARCRTYIYDDQIVINAKEFCKTNSLSYQMFLKHAKNITPYNGKIVRVQNAG